MAKRVHWAPVTEATYKEARQMDTEDARSVAMQDFPTGRLANFGAGHRDARPDVLPGAQMDHFANKRYGDQTQLPTSGPRRAGPVPYPETKDDYYRSVEDLRWSRAN